MKKIVFSFLTPFILQSSLLSTTAKADIFGDNTCARLAMYAGNTAAYSGLGSIASYLIDGYTDAEIDNPLLYGALAGGASGLALSILSEPVVTFFLDVFDSDVIRSLIFFPVLGALTPGIATINLFCE